VFTARYELGLYIKQSALLISRVKTAVNFKNCFIDFVEIC